MLSMCDLTTPPPPQQTLTRQVIIMQTPVGRFFKVLPINGVEWAISIAIGLSAVPASIVVRLVSRCVMLLCDAFPALPRPPACLLHMAERAGLPSGRVAA